MNEEIDESEFYHQDFTTASRWEMFIARIEEIIHDWTSSNSKDGRKLMRLGSFESQCEIIPFADTDFSLTYYKRDGVGEEEQKPKNPIENDFDFELEDGVNTHGDYCLSLWYGVNEYIVLSPLNSNSLVSESEIKILLSSLTAVAGNINCKLPLFMQIREKWQRCYLGVFEGNGMRTNFEMVHLSKGPRHSQYMTGLIDLFKTKLMSPLPLDPIIVSVQNTYHLSDFGNYVWRQDITDNDIENCTSSVLMLPLGVTVDPIASIKLKTTWNQIPDILVVDTESYTNFDPMHAPAWSVSIEKTDQPICLLADCLMDFLHVLGNGSTIYDCLGDYAQPPETSNPLDLLTESKVPTISSVLKRAARNSITKARKGVAPLSEEVLVPMLYFLFPDAEENSQNVYSDPLKKEEGNNENDVVSKYEDMFKGFKTCRMDSLVWRLSIVLSQALHSLGANRAFAHIWFEFVQEMRYRWEKSILIPGLATGFPDARTCLLHQKLQMLNCCIERKNAREAMIADREFSSAESSENEGDDDDEEFFDCSTDMEKSRQPVGRLGKFEDMKLLQTGEQLFIPITQDPVPKTEDQLEEDTDILLKLGSDAAGSELRARMMSASLLSDMESFKAANPGSILEDFIRWYSPRDWIEEEGEDEWGQKKGKLSSRMLISDNTWVEMWTTAKAVPANRQKRLFDDTREAEKVLHFLDSRNIGQIVELLLPVLAQAAICRVLDECDIVNVSVKDSEESLQKITKICERLTREPKVISNKYEALFLELVDLELNLSQANSLLYKFNPSGTKDDDLNVLVGDLIRGVEVEIEEKDDSLVGERLVTMFSDAQKALNMIVHDQAQVPSSTTFPQATKREFVLRVSSHRPAAYSARCPQYIRAVISRSEFRLCGAFSEDIVFF